MHTVQVTNISPEELVDRICKAFVPTVPAQAGPRAGIINVLNKRNAARVLGISEKLFTKLHARACIPCTVFAGTTKSGTPIHRWAEHHLQSIKPEIQKLRYVHDEREYKTASNHIHNILNI